MPPMAKENRPAVDWFVYLAVRVAAMIFQMFPIDLNLKTARLMGTIWCRLIPRHRARARDHLRAAFGSEMSERQIDRIALKSMQQMAMMAMELFFTPRLINEWTWPRHVKLKGIGPVMDVLLSKQGAILLTGHYGSWELVGYTLVALGFPMVAVMRPLDNPYLNRYLVGVRAKRGLKLLDKKGATRAADEILDSGGVLGFIADQNAGRKGMFVDFFGRKASTYKSIALLAITHEVPIIVGYARRLSDRFEYEVGCNRVIHPHEWASRDDEVEWITQEYTSAIERFVREAPEQYLWIHRRWKSRPRNERLLSEGASPGESDRFASAAG